MSTSNQSDYIRDKKPSTNLIATTTTIPTVVCVNNKPSDNVEEEKTKQFSNKPSFGEVKFIVQSLLPDNSTGSFDQSFEYKPILCDKIIKNDIKLALTRTNESSLCDFYDNMSESRVAYFNIGSKFKSDNNNIEFTPTPTTKLPTSTPLSKPMREFIAAQDEVKPCEKLNLLVPPSDAGFIDSDFESMEQDRYSNESVASDHSSNENFDPKDESFCERPRDYKSSRIEDRYIPTPVLAKNNVKLSRNPRILNIFSSERRQKYRNENIRRCLNQEDDLCEKKRFSKLKDCACLALTKENLDRYYKNDSSRFNNDLMSPANVEWGENFDFSFECQPSTSDNEDNTPHTSSIASKTSKVESKYENIPIFKIDPPPPCATPSTTPSSPLLPHLNISARGIFSIVTRSLEINPEQMSILRRSISDPACLLQQASSSTPSDDNDSDCDDDDTFETALFTNKTEINCANVKNLKTLTVSWYTYSFIFVNNNRKLLFFAD